MTCPDPYLTTTVPCEVPPTLGPPESVTTTVAQPSGSLPFTGGDVLGFAGIGLVILLIGIALTRYAVWREERSWDSP